MALLDFLDRRKKNKSGSEEMSFIDHLEELRWHLIRSVIAIGICAIVFFIYVREIVNDILLAPAQDNFITYKWFCDLSHAIGLGEFLLWEIPGRFPVTGCCGPVFLRQH